MIDISKFQIAQLVEIRDDLNFFINKKAVADVYREQGREKIELDLDRQLARTLLARVQARLLKLNQPARKRDSVRRRQET